MIKHRSKLRIALISGHASPLAAAGSADSGGQNIYVNHVARCLAAMGHCVDVFSRRDDAAAAPVDHVRPRFRVINVPAGPPHFVRKEQLLPLMSDFARHVEYVARASGGYDIVHANSFVSGVVAQRLRCSLGTPFVITMHSLGLVRRGHQPPAHGSPTDRITLERELVRTADRVITACPQDRDDLITAYGASERRLTFVPCGYDPDEFGPCDRRRVRGQFGLRDGEFVVLQLGRIALRNGIDDVIRAIARLVGEHGVNARLIVVGGETDNDSTNRTPEIERLRQVASDTGVAERVMFTGRRRREDLRAYYNAADVFATTPWYEPFDIKPLEAMACGTPVIGSNIGGIKYSVVDNVTGYLVPPHDPPALAAQLAVLAANPELGRAMGRAGMRRARSMFTWQRVVEQLVDVYMEVAQAPARESIGGEPLRKRLLPRMLRVIEARY